MLPAGTMSIDNGTKSVTYNAPINRGERGESRTFFVFRVLFFPFSLPPARSDRAPERERERVCMVESEEEREREREDIRLVPRDGPCAQVPRREFDCCSSMQRSLGLFACTAPEGGRRRRRNKSAAERLWGWTLLDSSLSPFPSPALSLSLSYSRGMFSKLTNKKT